MTHPLAPLAVRLLGAAGAKGPKVNVTSRGSILLRVSLYLGKDAAAAEGRLHVLTAMLRRFYAESPNASR